MECTDHHLQQKLIHSLPSHHFPDARRTLSPQMEAGNWGFERAAGTTNIKKGAGDNLQTHMSHRRQCNLCQWATGLSSLSWTFLHVDWSLCLQFKQEINFPDILNKMKQSHQSSPAYINLPHTRVIVMHTSDRRRYANRLNPYQRPCHLQDVVQFLSVGQRNLVA